MKNKLFKSIFMTTFCITSLTLATLNHAEELQKASVPTDLKVLAEKSKTEDQLTNQQRETEFLKNKQAQQALLKQALAELKIQELKSEQLEKQFSENEKNVDLVYKDLIEALGALKEIFGHLTASAGDLRAQLETSVVSAEYPDREFFLKNFISAMESDTRLPGSEQIEQLWQEMLNEMQASGTVRVFETQVVLPNGEFSAMPVYRVANFNLVSDKKYLSYSAESQLISELLRQPSGANLSELSTLKNLKDGAYVRFLIDPTGPIGGSYLKAMIASPGLIERWHQGGLIGYIITLFGLLALVLSALRFTDLNKKMHWVEQQVQDWQEGKKVDTTNLQNPLAQVLKVYQEDKNLEPDALEMRLADAILKQKPGIERYLSTIKIISMVAPLLGLLGTVAGMIVTFQAITLFGAGDPKTMAGGISSALVTTVLGLCVAIPAVLAHATLMSRANHINHILREQSAGLIALRYEHQNTQEKN